MKKRILSCFLALAMALSLLPMSVLAVGDGETNTSSLSPSSVSDDNVSISKTATRTGEDTWNVTMTVTAKEKDIESEPLELVLLLDRSGSMAWCTHNDHHHSSFSGGYWCRYEGETSAKDSRQAIAGNAAKNLIDQLVNLGISVSVSVVGFESDTNVLQFMTPLTEINATSIKNNIPTSRASGGTHMNEGLKAAASQFSDSTTNKVIVLLADGDYDGTNPNGPKGYVSTLKNKNITVHTIGFTTKNDTLSTIASSTRGQYYTADDASELANVFTQIAEHLTAMVEDDMGDDVQIVGTPSATNGAVTVSQDGKLSWNPEDGTLDAGETATITYQVKLTDSTKTTLQVGDNSVNLNRDAVLTYRVNEGPTKTLTFPVPTDTVQVGQLTTKVMLNDSEYSSTPGEKVIAYGDNSFSWVLPEDGATLEKDGITYTYAGSTYDDESISDTSKPATTGTHTLVHSYVSSHTLTYTWSGLPDGATVTPPTGGTYQYGAPVNLDKTYSSGHTVKVGHDTYTFSGWTATPDLEDGKMPAYNVTVSGAWTKTGEDPKNTVTYEVTSSENPSDYSPENLPNTVSYYEGDSVTVASPLTSSEETKDDVSGTWTFSGWSTKDVKVTDNQFTMPAKAVTFTGTWIFTPDTHTITINYEDGDSNPLKDVYTATQNDGSSYSFDVSEGSSGNIPFIITNDGTQYVFDRFTEDSATLSGTLTGDIAITAVYLVDKNKNNVPDVYEATVTYKVVNGTWSDDTTADKTATFALKKFDSGSNTWVVKDPAPTLGGTIPTDMQPKDGYKDGTWDTPITQDTSVTGSITYAYTFKEIPTPDLDWDVSRSKTATNLDKNYESQVTLSLPSAEETLTSDVVFVLDKSSCGNTVTEQALDMLEELYDAASENNATIKVGAVQFAGEAVVSCALTDLTKDAVAKDGAIYDGLHKKQTGDLSGTNLQAGLLKAQEMLAADTSVQANRKYVVVITDGLTRQFLAEDGTVMAIYNAIDADGTQIWANTTSWCVANGFEDGIFNIPEKNWDTYFNIVTENVAKDGDTYAHWMDWAPGDGEEGYVPVGENSLDHALCLDRAIYEANVVYRELEDAGYNCYTVFSNATPNNQLGEAFVDYLNDGKTVNFDAIQDEISYLVDDGSYVVDEIGSGTDNKGNAYNFDFVNQAGKLTLKVGEETYSVVSISARDGATASYGFGDAHNGIYPYVLNYYQNGTKDVASEHFVWEINVPVSNFAHVQLTYSVKLTNPQSRAGTYGQYDADGSEGYTSLYTNTSAVLTPVDSNDVQGPEQFFAKPTVSYTIKKHDGGGDVEPPVLDTENHYGYIVGYDDGTVRPNGKITRAEVATIFFRLLTDESRDAYWCQTNDFSDVSASDWFNNAISTLTNAGILDGYEDGTFRPNGNITRAEFATIAVRFFDLTYEGEDLFPDISDHWARDYINQAAAAGFVNGYEDGTFRPNNAITRAEAVTLVNRTLERKPHKAHLLADMIQWPDNMDQTTWYYADIQEATNSHEYYMTTSEQGEEYEIWTELLPMRDWPALEKEWSDANSSTGADVTR